MASAKKVVSQLNALLMYGNKRQGYYPPALAGYDYNPKTDRYMKKCKDYQVRDEKTNRCTGKKDKKDKKDKKGSDLASKAMKLKHKEGISLKQAWKRVKSGETKSKPKKR
jgi:hypothetical protein